MAINWPSNLPLTLDQDGYSESPQKTVIRSPMDAGPAKVRRRFTANVRPISGKLNLRGSDGTLASFQNFFTTILLDGSLQFSWMDQTTGVVSNYRFNTDKEPSWTNQGDLYQVTVALEIMP